MKATGTDNRDSRNNPHSTKNRHSRDHQHSKQSTYRRLVVQKTAEGSKPPSVHPSIRLSVRAVIRATYPRGLAPARIRRSIHSFRSTWRSHALGGSTPRSFTWREPSFGSGSRTSSVPKSGLVSVPEPAVSRSGFASGRLPGRWGDFPHGRTSVASYPRELGSLCHSNVASDRV
jgi:hypothetical protein